MTAELEQFTFPRTGDSALACRGTLLAEASSQRDKGHLSQRWHELKLVKTERGNYVIAWSYRSTWGHETHVDDAEAVPNASAVPPALLGYDPLADVAGFPNGEQFISKQKRLEWELENGYKAACGRLLAQAGIVEEV